MEGQNNDRTDSRRSSGGSSSSRNQQILSKYDVPIPRPTTDLGFRGIRRKRPNFDSQPLRRRDN